jgi:dolichol-phosphate mannosyltransferase
VVCPAFNEEEVLPLFHPELAEALRPLEADYRIEILYVDDGSRDGTLEVLRRLARIDGRVRYLSLSRNFGHQAALTAGLEHARGDAVVSLDADLQHPPRLIPELVARWRAGHDVVLTVRADDPRLGRFKRATSRLFYRLLGRFSSVEVRAAASDFRLLSRRAVSALLRLSETHRFLRGMVQWLGFPRAEVVYQPDPRRAGVSKYTLSRMVRLAADGLMSFSRAPLRLTAGSGVLLTAVSAAACLAVLLARRADPSVTLLVAAGHLVAVTQLAAVWVVGEYVGRIYEECKHRPVYLVKEQSPAGRAEAAAEAPEFSPRGSDRSLSVA